MCVYSIKVWLAVTCWCSLGLAASRLLRPASDKNVSCVPQKAIINTLPRVSNLKIPSACVRPDNSICCHHCHRQMSQVGYQNNSRETHSVSRCLPLLFLWLFFDVGTESNVDSQVIPVCPPLFVLCLCLLFSWFQGNRLPYSFFGYHAAAPSFLFSGVIVQWTALLHASFCQTSQFEWRQPVSTGHWPILVWDLFCCLFVCFLLLRLEGFAVWHVLTDHWKSLDLETAHMFPHIFGGGPPAGWSSRFLTSNEKWVG